MLVKTKSVSNQLKVNPSTIQRWVKYFDLPCHKNNHGHLLFNEQNINQLEHIKVQLNNGLSMEEVELNNIKEKPLDKSISMNDYEKKLDKMVSRINGVEEKLAQKADEVVSIQLYQHRNELDQLMKTVGDVEDRLQTIETQLSSLTPQPYQEEKEIKKDRPRKNWFVSIFST